MSLNSFAGSRFAGYLALLAVVSGCSSAPPSSSIATSPTPLVSPSPQASPTTPAVSTPPATSQPNAAVSNNSPTETIRKVEQCVIRMAKVNDPESPLNVRSTPNTTSSIVAKLQNGTYVDVQEEQNGWFKIGGQTPGWIAKSKTESNCGQKVEQIQLGANQDSIEIRDRFIGVGSHRYRFNFTKGQKLTVTTAQGGVFPRIVAPSGKNLIVPPEQRASWTGELTETGDYQFVLDSNFKGYQYAFEVNVR